MKISLNFEYSHPYKHFLFAQMHHTIFQAATLCFQIVYAASTTKTSLATQPPRTENKTLEQLMTDQTEAVRKIIEAQRESEVDYPIVTKKESDTKQVTEKVKENTEDINIHCQQLLKDQQQQQKQQQQHHQHQQQQQNIMGTASPIPEVSVKITENVRPSGPFVKPDFGRRKPGLAPDNADNVKLIKFEPVILQKNILKDGQVVYYWHKSLPFPQYVVVPETQQQITPSSTTTTTTSTTTTTTPKSITNTGSYEDIYAQPLRFVVPVPYVPENGYKYPDNYDPYGYYSRYVNPQSAVPVEVPVPPTLPIIRTLLVPNKYLNKRVEKTGATP